MFGSVGCEMGGPGQTSNIKQPEVLVSHSCNETVTWIEGTPGNSTGCLPLSCKARGGEKGDGERAQWVRKKERGRCGPHG